MMAFQQFQSPADTLIGWAKRQMTETRQPLAKFAEAVAENYLQIVPEGRRTCPLDEIPHDACMEDHFRIQAKNAIAVDRWVKGTIKLPLEVLDAWVASLDGKYRDGCVAELFGRFGLVPVAANAVADAANFSKTMYATADMVSSLAKIVADGVVDEEDREHIKSAREQMTALKSQIAGWEYLFLQVETA